MFDYADIESQLAAFDACFFCLGVSSTGMSEADYARITHDIAVAAAQTLSRLNPRMIFVLVSGAGADGTERGRVMWLASKAKPKTSISASPSKPSLFSVPASSSRFMVSSLKPPDTAYSAGWQNYFCPAPAASSLIASSPPN